MPTVLTNAIGSFEAESAAASATLNPNAVTLFQDNIFTASSGDKITKLSAFARGNFGNDTAEAVFMVVNAANDTVIAVQALYIPYAGSRSLHEIVVDIPLSDGVTYYLALGANNASVGFQGHTVNATGERATSNNGYNVGAVLSGDNYTGGGAQVSWADVTVGDVSPNITINDGNPIQLYEGQTLQDIDFSLTNADGVTITGLDFGGTAATDVQHVEGASAGTFDLAPSAPEGSGTGSATYTDA